MIIIFGPFRQKKPLEIKGLLSRLAQILAVRFPLCYEVNQTHYEITDFLTSMIRLDYNQLERKN